jgi:hypothetical protein
MNCLLVRLVLWFVTLAIFPIPLPLLAQSFQVEVLQRITLAALPQERPGVEWTERVLLQLEKAEKTEIDPWYRDDIRIAWITTRWSQHGIPIWSLHGYATAYVAATFQVLHCHPDQVFSGITARRKAMLGAEYADFFPDGASSPKKPCVSVGTPPRSKDGLKRSLA